MAPAWSRSAATSIEAAPGRSRAKFCHAARISSRCSRMNCDRRGIQVGSIQYQALVQHHLVNAQFVPHRHEIDVLAEELDSREVPNGTSRRFGPSPSQDAPVTRSCYLDDTSSTRVRA